MKAKSAFILFLLLMVAATAPAWESHKRSSRPYDLMGDLRFDNEHVEITEQAIKAVDAFSFMGSPSGRPLEVCGKVKDFNSALLGWDELKEREFCPANFSELSDFFYSMEDYINQGNKCPPLADWYVDECHSFEHFMGALNSIHFPPQTKTIYTQYHRIAEAIIDQSKELYSKLNGAGALSMYKDYWEECRMEALTYESMGQHFLQDQWSQGHMWQRWGGPDVDDFPLEGTVLDVFSDKSKGKLAYGTLVGMVSGMVHGWKSTVEPLSPYLPSVVDDAMCYNRSGVEWLHSYFTEPEPGMGDLFFHQAGDFGIQKERLSGCTEDSLRELELIGLYPDDMCWDNYATNRAMNIGLNLSPSGPIFQGLLTVAAQYYKGSNTYENVIIPAFQGDLLRLSAKFAWAALKDPDDTYLAEGYTSKGRTERLEFFGIMPNSEYNRLPNYIDPARNAPGDPADTTGVQPDNGLFGVRQVRYFNKCHADLYCEDPEVVNGYRDGCFSETNKDREVDCQICEELGSRFFLGEPSLCSILAPGVNPEPIEDYRPETAEEVSKWCREKRNVPKVYRGKGTYIYTWIYYKNTRIDHVCNNGETDFIVTLYDDGMFDVDFIDNISASIDFSGNDYYEEYYGNKYYFGVNCDVPEPDPSHIWDNALWGTHKDGSLILNQYSDGEFSGNYSEIYLSGKGYTVYRAGRDNRIIDKYYYSFDKLKNVSY